MQSNFVMQNMTQNACMPLKGSVAYVSGMDTNFSAKTITEFYQWETEGFIPPIAKPEQEFLDSGMFCLFVKKTRTLHLE